MNRVILIGRLTKDAELRYTANGLAVSTGSIAVNQGFGDKKKTDFFNVKCFGKTAENFANLGKKGVQIALEGNIGFNQYEKDGKQIKNFEITIETFYLLEKRKEASNENSSILQGETIDIPDEALPF